MKKTRKVQLLATILGATAVVAGLALLNAPVQASAAETAVFAMEKGASVRAVADEAGIRWITNVNTAWYNSVVKGLAEGQTIADYSFGTFVTSVDNVTTEEGEIDVTKLTSTTKEVKNLACDKEKTPDFTKEETTFTYYSSIVYTAEDLAGYTTEEVQKAYAAELIARSYMKYTLVGSETEYYVYADSNDNQRCMRLVAVLAYYETDETKKLTDTQKGYVDDYFIKPEGDTLPTVDFGGYYETAIGKTNSAYTAAYYDGKQVGEADENDTLWVTLGYLGTKNYIIYLFDDAGNCAKTNAFRYITALLNQDNFDDYINVSGTISGYYVLSSDIKLGDTYYGVSNTFAGTLDGKGFTISGINVTGSTEADSKGGLFQSLQGTVKNVSIKGSHARRGGIIAGYCKNNALIENVYVESEALTYEAAAPISRFCQGSNIKLVNVVTVMKGRASSTKIPGSVFGTVSRSQPLPTLTNCYYITVEGVKPIGAVDSSSYYTANDVETVFGEEKTSGNVTTYTKEGTVILTGYTGATFTDAKTAFDDAVGKNPNMISAELKKLMGYSTATN